MYKPFLNSLLLLYFLQASNVFALPVLSPDGRQLSNLRIAGHGTFDVYFGDGVIGDVYSDDIFDNDRYELVETLEFVLELEIARLALEPNFYSGCTSIELCEFILPDFFPRFLRSDPQTEYYVDRFRTVLYIGGVLLPPDGGHLTGKRYLLPDFDTSSRDDMTLVTYRRVPEVPVASPLYLILSTVVFLYLRQRLRTIRKIR